MVASSGGRINVGSYTQEVRACSLSAVSALASAFGFSALATRPPSPVPQTRVC